LLTQLRQGSAVDALGRKHIDVEQLRKLLRRERFRRTERHVAGIVDHDVEASVVGDDLRDAGFGGFVRGDVEFDGPEVDAVLAGIACDFCDLGGVAAGGLAHAGVDDVAGMSEGTGGERAKAARSTGDDNNLFH